MEHIAPLLQTVLWVGLVAGILFRFHKPLHDLLTAVQKRIESGSSLKAGWLELGELKPQAPEQQKQKTEAELDELDQEGPSVTLATGTPRSLNRAHLLQVEDLALRAIQVQYGVPITRQVTFGSDVGFDGAFFLGERLFVVEVKYYRGWVQGAKLRSSMERLVAALRHRGTGGAQIVLAAVFERSEDLEVNRKRIAEVVDSLPIPAVAHLYAVPDLRARFGASGSVDG